MMPPVEIRDREAYKRSMRDLLRLEPARTVALTVDMQRDYVDPSVATAPVPERIAKDVVASTARLLDGCRKRGIPVIHCYVVRRSQEAEKDFYSTPFGRMSRKASLSQNVTGKQRPDIDRIAGSASSELPPEIVAPSDLHVTTKRAMNSFHLTDLEMLLTRVYRPDALLITGVNTDTCVQSTTFGASDRGYKPVLVSECVASMRGDDNHWMALELMSRTIAWVLDIDAVFEKLDAGA